MGHLQFSRLIACLLFIFPCLYAFSSETRPLRDTVSQMQTISSQYPAQMIWDGAPYNAFTDLIYFNKQFFCCFRESNDPQVGDNGTIRIISSPDATVWTSVTVLSLNGYDLRDPKFSVTPDGKLMLNLGATLWGSGNSETLNSGVTFSADGVNWGPVQVLSYTGQWIWHVVWNQGTAYGVAYSIDGSNSEITLMSSPDGINYTEVYDFNLDKSPNETTLRFLPDNTMVALVRRNGGPGLIGTAPPPYQQWTWYDTHSTLGGPDFLILPDGSMWASSRQIKGTKETCILASMSVDSYQPVLTFASKGDSGYPGMVYKDGNLYVSYYSSQTGNACIYLAIIPIDMIDNTSTRNFYSSKILFTPPN